MKKQPGSDTEILTLHEVADYLLCDCTIVRRLLADRAIPGFRLGSDWRLRRSDLEKWITEQTVVSQTEPAS